MPRQAIPANPADYPCGFGACNRTPVVVTEGNTRPTVIAHCPDHLPEQVTFSVDAVEAWANQGY